MKSTTYIIKHKLCFCCSVTMAISQILVEDELSFISGICCFCLVDPEPHLFVRVVTLPRTSKILVLVLTLPPTNCVALGKLYAFSEPSLPHLEKMGIIIR